MKILVCLLCHLCLLSGLTVRSANAQDELKQVTIQLKWFHQFQFAGYYAALHKGFYREEGLEVVIKPGGPQVIVDDEVLSGRAEYGVLGSELIQMKTSGKPLVLLAVIMQHSPRAIIVRADSGIDGPADLVGKHLMINRHEDVEFQAMFVAEGIAYEKLSITPKDESADARFIEGKIDGLNGSIGNQPYIYNKRNIAVKTIRPINYGIDFYGDSLFTSEAQIEKDIEQVEKVRRATIRGWYYAMDNVGEMADLIIAEYSAETSREHLLVEAEAMKKLILPDLVDIGHVSRHRLERIAQIYADLKLVRPDYSLKGFIYDPAEDTTSIIRVVAILSIILAIASIVGVTLLLFNSRLKKLVMERTEELQSSNLLLNAVIEGTTDAIFLKNLKGQYLLANSAALQAIGRAAPEVIGKDDSELFPAESARVIKEADQSVLQSGQPQIFEEQLETSYGISYWLANKSPYRDQEGNTIGLIGISRNISDLKKNEEEKKALQKQLVQAQKMESIGTLAGGIAHDFNNLLAAMMGYAEIVRDGSPAGSQAADDLEQVLLAGERAKGLVKQILTFSRLTDSTRIPIQPALLVKETIKLLRSSIPATIAIKQEIAADSDFILADPTELHQIILNFCTNAFHAMEEKGGTLTIGLQSKTITEDELPSQYEVTPGEFVQMTVADTGSGIAPDILEKIFDPYFTTKEIGKGTGMGLSIAHGIVKSCNGFITCHSKLGEGTVFQVFFPVITDDIVPVAEHADRIRFGSERILFIDDEVMLAEMGKNMLEGLGYRVTVRNDSSEALATFRNRPDDFDLVITDQTMPGITGSDLARRMLEIRPGMPIILCTGYSALVSEEKAGTLGIKGFALKPLTKKDLAALIRKVLDEERSLL